MRMPDSLGFNATLSFGSFPNAVLRSLIRRMGRNVRSKAKRALRARCRDRARFTVRQPHEVRSQL